jgi:methionyl-tRNA formyltransferase
VSENCVQSKSALYPVLASDPGIVFMGTPSFAVPSLEALCRAGYRVPAVVTQPDRPKGRGRKSAPSAVKECALRMGLRVLQPERASDQGFIKMIRDMDPDLLVVVAFGQILRPALLEAAKAGALNIHASLLPRYRGPAPIQWAILKGEEMTGLTAMLMDKGLDTGPILLQREIAIGKDETFGELHDKLAQASAPFLLETLDGLKKGLLRPKIQEESKACYAPKLDKGIARLDWAAPASDICAVIKALDPSPGAVTSFKGEAIKVFSCSEGPATSSLDLPGRVLSIGRDGMLVQAGRGSVLIRAVQVPGRRKVASFEYAGSAGLSPGLLLGG